MEVYEKFHNPKHSFYTQKTNTLAENNYHCYQFSVPHPSSRERLLGNKKVIQLQDYFIIDLFSKTTNKIAR